MYAAMKVTASTIGATTIRAIGWNELSPLGNADCSHRSAPAPAARPTTSPRIRIGTDEPGRLAEAIRQVVPRQEGAAGAFVISPGFNPTVRVLVGVVVPCIVIVGVMTYRLSGPVVVRVSPDRISVRGSTHSDEIPAWDVVSVSLEPALPEMSRTRGFGFGGTLRGRVRFRDGGVGQ